MTRINEKLILRTEQNEIFTPKTYKIFPNTVSSSIFNSLLSSEKIDTNKVAAIHYLVGNQFLQKNISELNNKNVFDSINSIRNGQLTFVNIKKIQDNNLESLPSSYHISETIQNLERLSNEYTRKTSLLQYSSQKIYNLDYAKNMWMVGRFKEIKVTNDKLIFDTQDNQTRISGYVKVEDAPENIQVNLIFRGIPVPMRKTLTSKFGGKFNYIFTYPQYLLEGNIDSVQAINHLEVKNHTGAKFFYGNTYYFDVTNLAGFGNKLANIHIINKGTRNLFNQVELITNP
jgi:hypothetical protein